VHFPGEKQKFSQAFLDYMNVPDEVELENAIIIEGRWKNEWNNAIQIPFVRIADLPKAAVRILPQEQEQQQAQKQQQQESAVSVAKELRGRGAK